MFALYLTGAPATGKSTTAMAVARATNAKYLSYGEMLTTNLAANVHSQTELRSKSAQVISPTSVRSMDRIVARTMRKESRRGSVVIDSHPITRESYGFRAVPYSAQDLRRLHFTHIVCLSASAETVRARIAEDPGGRPMLTLEDFDRHASLQDAMAVTYAHTLGVPIAFVDSARPLGDVIGTILDFVAD
jgi:adenylate kinase